MMQGLEIGIGQQVDDRYRYRYIDKQMQMIQTDDRRNILIDVDRHVSDKPYYVTHIKRKNIGDLLKVK